MGVLNEPLYFQFIAALLSCFFLKKESFFLRILSLFLIVTFLVELIGDYLNGLKVDNFTLYHFYTLFEFSIIFIMLKSVIKQKKLLIYSSVLLFVLLFLWVLAFFSRKYLFVMTIVGSFNVGYLVFLYLRELLLSNELINYKKQLPFWVSVGLIVFYLPSIPFFSFWNFMKDRSLLPILEALVILMNIIISFGLIWSNKKEKSY